MNNLNRIRLIDLETVTSKVKDQNRQERIKIVFNLDHKKIKNNGSIQTDLSIKTTMTIIKISHSIKRNQSEYN